MRLLTEYDYIRFLRDLVSRRPRKVYRIDKDLFVETRPGFTISFMDYEDDLPDYIDSVVEELLIKTKPSILIPYGDPSFMDYLEGTCILFFLGEWYRAFVVIESSSLILCFAKTFDGILSRGKCLVKILKEKPFLGIAWGQCSIK